MRFVLCIGHRYCDWSWDRLLDGTISSQIIQLFNKGVNNDGPLKGNGSEGHTYFNKP